MLASAQADERKKLAGKIAQFYAPQGAMQEIG
jgi:hypothetical protein